jgi:hypothetical protein
MTEKKQKVRYIHSYTEAPFVHTSYVLRWTESGSIELWKWFGDIEGSMLVQTFKPYSIDNNYEEYIQNILNSCLQLISKSSRGKTLFVETMLKYEPNTKRWLTAKKKKESADLIGMNIADERAKYGMFF